MKLFGREPTLWIGALSAVLSFIVTFNVNGLSEVQAALWITGINAVLGAWAAVRTRPIAPQAFTYVLSSAASLAAAYGLSWPPERLGAANVVLMAVLLLLTRGQVSPKEEVAATRYAARRAV